MSNGRAAAILAVTIALAAGAGGCKGGAGKTPSAKDLVGTWVEVPEDAPGKNNPRFSAPPRLSKEMRKVVFNEDGTYKLTLVKADGSAIDDSKFLEGTWKVDEVGAYVIESKKNTLGEKFAGWNVSGFGGFRAEPGDKGAASKCLIAHENGDMAAYKRN